MGDVRGIGIVICHNGYEERAYIGRGVGGTQEEDERSIAARGARFPLHIAQQLINGGGAS
jgi:hypothetical protein